MLKEIPKAVPNNNPFHENHPDVKNVKPKTATIAELGFNRNQVSEFQRMADNEDIVLDDFNLVDGVMGYPGDLCEFFLCVYRTFVRNLTNVCPRSLFFFRPLRYQRLQLQGKNTAVVSRQVPAIAAL